jgi:NitT/TauT family transport system ATP-binding protein
MEFDSGGGQLLVLDNVNLDVKVGEFIALLGPSGCGKSTLLNLAGGLLLPTLGQVVYADGPVTGVNTRVGYVTQQDNLLPWRTARDNVGLALEIRGSMSRHERRERVDTMLSTMGLSGFGNFYPAQLSGGMRKRVTLARTLIYDPETLLMDEPFGALDAQLKLVLQDELLRLWEASGKTILFVTHDLAEAVTLADRVVVFSARPARIKYIQNIDLPRPRDPFQVRFAERFRELNELIWGAMRDDFRNGSELT